MAMTTPSMPSVNPLNPTLYALLEHKFGEVKISNAGASANIQRFADPYNPGRVIKRAHWWGEYYCVNCPFCNDYGQKLWINHLYGADYNSKTGRRTDTFLAHCYKNGCLAVEGRPLQLEQMIFGPGRRIVKSLPVRLGDPSAAAEVLTQPGTIIPLTDLPTDHRAVVYLRSRNFDVAELTATFGLGLCVDAPPKPHGLMNNRIYIPTYMDGQLVAWQGRLTRPSRYEREPKYYTQGRKSLALYNYAAAARQDYLIIVEGAPSVWRIGAPAVSLFGKSLSFWQENTIATTWNGKPVFIVFDYGETDAIEKAAAQLCRHNLHVVPVLMPDERDPADYSRAELRELLSRAAAQVNVSVDLSTLR